MKVRHANDGDAVWLAGHDRHVDVDWMARCIGHREYLVCERDDVRVGFLRYSRFWGVIPYMDMVLVLEGHRCAGAGTALFSRWEALMREGGAKILMTSSTSGEEEPLAWHRRNGFERSGRLTFGRHDPSPEDFLVKDLQDRGR